MSDDIMVKEGHIYGGWRQPVNIWMGIPGSIHADNVAQKVGMRGGTIPGTIHLNLFPPLLIKAFGERWFERGSLSMYYTYATMHLEEVRAVITVPPEGIEDAQVEAWVETPEGRTVARGTVSVGNPKEPSYLQATELKNADPSELRILAGLKAGDELPSRDVLVTRNDVNKMLETITDPIDWYKDSSPWGKPILPPAVMYNAMMLTPRRPGNQPMRAVGFFGATEVRNVNGPIKVGVPYRAGGRLVCVGASPKTEYFWYDSYLDEKESGRRIAEMRHMTRLMKASSPLY
jgi:hypothetical protein